MNSNLYNNVDILVNGRPVKKYTHEGKVFIEAKDGTEYTIKFYNGDWKKVLAIFSVDGINAVNGKAAGSTDSGYVLDPWNSYEVKGFRVSENIVNAFKFSKKKESYAAKSDETGGDTRNCGVIGLNVFHEKVNPNVWKTIRPYRMYDESEVINLYSYSGSLPLTKGRLISNTSNRAGGQSLNFNSHTLSANSAQAPISSYTYHSNTEDIDDGHTVCDSLPYEPERSIKKAAFDLGTEFSDKEIRDYVDTVTFEKGLSLGTVEIFYASREALIDMGVPVEKKTRVAFPQAFPSKFCKPPTK